jgi:hypothetical protein
VSCGAYFDVRGVGLASAFVPVAIGLLLLAIGIAAVKYGRRPGRWLILPMAVVVIGLGIDEVARYVSLRRAVTAGTLRKSEGFIRNFARSPYRPKYESFDVGGRHFGYFREDLGPAFHRTQSDGGPLGDGVYVRIWDRDGEIARLEVCLPSL